MRKTATILTASLLLFGTTIKAQKGISEPIPSCKPSKYQKQQIKRKYGMFMHFGINTFADQEWTDGSVPASQYNPETIDADQWIKTAKDAGMKYVILITKHHDGFCLWDSQYTKYDVGSSKNKTNVIEEVAKACKKYKIGLGLYYSLWDRTENPNTKDSSLDKSYNQYMVNQLNEILDIAQKYTHVVEFWFDGSWEKSHDRWGLDEIYTTIKSREPGCQIGVNWSIGLPNDIDHHPVLPTEQKEGYPIRFFPSDFRLGDPKMPANPDPKLFTHNGDTYYMPWESTVCLSASGKWFYNTKDKKLKSKSELLELYKTATTQDNILIFNVPPDRTGHIPQTEVDLLKKLRKDIDKL